MAKCGVSFSHLFEQHTQFWGTVKPGIPEKPIPQHRRGSSIGTSAKSRRGQRTAGGQSMDQEGPEPGGARWCAACASPTGAGIAFWSWAGPSSTALSAWGTGRRGAGTKRKDLDGPRSSATRSAGVGLLQPARTCPRWAPSLRPAPRREPGLGAEAEVRAANEPRQVSGACSKGPSPVEVGSMGTLSNEVLWRVGPGRAFSNQLGRPSSPAIGGAARCGAGLSGPSPIGGGRGGVGSGRGAKVRGGRRPQFPARAGSGGRSAPWLAWGGRARGPARRCPPGSGRSWSGSGPSWRP